MPESRARVVILHRWAESWKGRGKCLFPNQAPGMGLFTLCTHATGSSRQTYPVGTFLELSLSPVVDSLGIAWRGRA